MVKFKLVPGSKKRVFAPLAGISQARKYVGRATMVFVALGVLLTSTVLTSGSASAAGHDIPSDVQPTKFNHGDICVRSALNSSSYPVAAIAQQWNLAVNSATTKPIALTFATKCINPSQSITVGTFNNPNGDCLAFTNTNKRYEAGDLSAMYYWSAGVGVYINVGIPGCVSTAQRRAHQVAAGIGYALGLNMMTTSGYSNRVMCTCSIDTVRSPDSSSADQVWKIYTGYYGG